MAGNARQLSQNHSDSLRPRCRFHSQQLFYRQDITQIVRHRREVIHAVCHHQRFGEGLGLHALFYASMQKANIGGEVDNILTVQLYQQTQHAVRTGMLRPHTKQHMLFGIFNVHAGANFGPEFFYS